MNTTKMSANSAVSRLVASINENDKGSFYKIANEYLESLAYGGANWSEVKRSLNRRPMDMVTLDKLSSDVKKLISNDVEKSEFVFVNKDLDTFIKEILFEWQKKDVYVSHNLNIRNKILLHGPTGNGKTTIARNIAKQSKMPFVEVRADMMIDSHLGNTGQNIYKLFNSIKEPCILFWDEVDSIGKKRGTADSSSAAYENERMVNSILVNIDKLENDVIFVGATNRKDILDEAFLRRFDIVFEVKNPTNIEKSSFAESLFDYHNIPRQIIYPNDFSNYSEIKDYVINIARQYVIQKISQVS
jgi:SpoVK/Ycf46/Vps4 family AAA+-type ATPase